ncbi:MAG: phosphate/phosphite/phosphonate ABC transporter substrate-binding protein [Deltaproteobacteria bacterium]|nr:MAG: phosphate/phosphite/phosphonate ABC transporter substrate-binding protein [Deltaproteobacteria bacterium]
MQKKILKSIPCLLVVFLILAIPFNSYAAAPGAVGSPAPPFVLRDLEGKLFSFSKLCGKNVPEEQKKVYILTFFATWCEPCKKEIPIMTKILQEWGDRGVGILYIGFRQGNKDLRPFAKENNLNMTVLGDKYGVTAKKYGVNSLPRSLIVDEDCIIQSHVRGALKNLEEVLTGKLSEILSVPMPVAKAEPTPTKEEQKTKSVLTFGRVPSYQEVEETSNWEPLLTYLKDELKVDIRYESAESYAAFVKKMKAETFDFVNVGPLQYLQTSKQYEPIAKVVRQDQEFYSGIIFAKNSSSIKELKDLKGKKVAFVSKNSTSGYFFPKLLLYQNGLAYGKDYEGKIFRRHDDVARAVIEGKFDAGACFEDCRYFAYKGNEAKIDETHIVANTEKIPADPILVKKSLDEKTKQALQEAILKANKNKEVMTNLGKVDEWLTGFVKAGASDYEKLMEYYSLLKSYEKPEEKSKNPNDQ